MNISKDDVTNDSITLDYLLQTLREYCREILMGTGIAVLLAGVVVAMAPTEFEVQAIVQIGQIGQFTKLGRVEIQFIESSSKVASRLRLNGFQDAAMRRTVKSSTVVQRSDILSVLVRENGPDLVEIRVRARSLDHGVSFIRGLVLELQNQHEKEISSREELIGWIFEFKQHERKILEDAYLPPKGTSGLAKTMTSPFDKIINANFSNALVSAQVRLAELNNELVLLKMALDIQATQPTQFLYGAENGISIGPIFPDKSKILLAVGVAGAIVFTVLAVLRRRIYDKKMKQND